MIRRLCLFLCLIAATNQWMIAQKLSTQGIVDQFFPQKLANPAFPNDRGNCSGVLQVAADGSPSVIFANYLAEPGAIRILVRGTDGVFTAIDGPSGLSLGGSLCSVEFIDVYGDGGKEIHLAITGAVAGTADWLFRWNGSILTTLNPVISDKFANESAWGNANFADLYHDGTLAVYCVQSGLAADDGKTGQPDTVYHLQNGTFQRSANALFLALLPADPSTPYRTTFVLPRGSAGPYNLRVINGDSQGNNRASGQVFINGQSITSFSKSGASLTSSAISVNAASANQLTVQFDTLYTAGQVNIVVEDQSPGPSPPSSLTTVATGATQIKVSFVPSDSKGVYSYQFYRGLQSGVTPTSGNLVRLDRISSTTFMDRRLLPSTTYYYLAQAINGYGPSVPSNEASATTGSQASFVTTPPNPPTPRD